MPYETDPALAGRRGIAGLVDPRWRNDVATNQSKGPTYPQSWGDTYNAQAPGTQQAMADRFGGRSQTDIEKDWSGNIRPMYAEGTTPDQILGGIGSLLKPSDTPGGGGGGGGFLSKGGRGGAASQFGQRANFDPQANLRSLGFLGGEIPPPAIPTDVPTPPAVNPNGIGARKRARMGETPPPPETPPGVPPPVAPQAGPGALKRERVGLQGLVKDPTKRWQGIVDAAGGAGTPEWAAYKQAQIAGQAARRPDLRPDLLWKSWKDQHGYAGENFGHQF